MEHEKFLKLTDDNINSAINAGSDSIKGMISYLVDTINSLHETNEQLQEEVNRLKAIITKDSHNSHKPPSTDGVKKRSKIKNLRTKSNKKSGGQKGHKGSTLGLSDNPDKKIELRVKHCDNCHKSLKNSPVIGHPWWKKKIRNGQEE